VDDPTRPGQVVDRFDAAPVMAELKRFQRRTVDHVFDAFYQNGQKNFLVADETGLGKSIVARGLIARAIEYLQDSDIDRIDIVYVCSNASLARQNLTRLTVTGKDAPLNTRLTLLALELANFDSGPVFEGKRVNFVSFTPGTSFNTDRFGKSEERALLHVLLTDLLHLSPPQRRAAAMFLQGYVGSRARFEATIAHIRAQLAGPVDPRIVAGFDKRAQADGLFDWFRSVLDRLACKQKLPDDVRTEQSKLISAMRSALAFAGVDVLTPDLVILDEFQRFRELLDDIDAGDQPDSDPAATLARYLFGYSDAKVLLLSATPYKAYTGPEEFADDHAADFFRVLQFLFGDDTVEVGQIATALSKYRQSIVGGADPSDVATDIRQLLLKVMCRTERPQTATMLTEVDLITDPPTAGDLDGYRALAAISEKFQGNRYWSIGSRFRISQISWVPTNWARSLKWDCGPPIRR
jgi:hypothetical protein